jgi:hypothetical protein
MQGCDHHLGATSDGCPFIRQAAVGNGKRDPDFLDQSTGQNFKFYWGVLYFMVTLKTSSMVVTPFRSF